MNRFLFAFIPGILLVCFSGSVLSQVAPPAARATQPFIEFKVGQYKPADAEDGILFGMSTGRRIDDRLFWGFEGDYFYSSYTRATNVTGGGDTPQFVDFRTSILTLLFQIYYEARMGPGSFFFRGSGSLGMDMIWDKQQNVGTGISRTDFFTGFAFQITGGVGWQISRRGLLFFDLLYHGSNFTSGDTVLIDDLPVRRSINVSGFGFRGGINIIGFWFWKW